MEHGLNPLVAFAAHQLHWCLIFMGTVYAFKIRWILKHPAAKDRQAPTGEADQTPDRGGWYSVFAIAMPWTLNSFREHPMMYAQFVIFHICVATSIAMSFVFSYKPVWLAAPATVAAIQVIFAAGFAVGVYRLARRIFTPVMRMISSPDDFFSMALLLVWVAFSFLVIGQAPAFAVALGQLEASQVANPALKDTPLIAYYFLTAFFLFYVPFSKISHYIYYPFTRWHFGRTMGHRGIYPLKRLDKMTAKGR